MQLYYIKNIFLESEYIKLFNLFLAPNIVVWNLKQYYFYYFRDFF